MLTWIKEHPYLTGSMIVGVFILYLVYKNSQSSAGPSGTQTVGPSDALQATAINANAGIQAATLSAQTHVAGYNAAVQINAQNTSADVTKAQLQQTVDLTYLLSTADVANTKTAAQLQLGLAQTGATVAVASIDAGGTIPFSVVGYGTVRGMQGTSAGYIDGRINAGVAGMPTPTNPGSSAYYPGLQAVFDQNGTPLNSFAAQQNPDFYSGYRAGETAPVPSAVGYGDYGSYHLADLSTLPNAAPGGFVNNYVTGYDQSAIDAANYEFLHDPNSCHNVVCDASGHPIAA